MTEAGLAHLTSPDDNDRLVREVVRKDFLSQFYSRAANRCRAASNGGAGADFFRDLKGFLKEAIQRAAGELRAMGDLISLFDLARDFGLAKHHRVQTRSNLEQVAGSVEVFVQIRVRLEIARLRAK